MAQIIQGGLAGPTPGQYAQQASGVAQQGLASGMQLGEQIRKTKVAQYWSVLQDLAATNPYKLPGALKDNPTLVKSLIGVMGIPKDQADAFMQQLQNQPIDAATQLNGIASLYMQGGTEAQGQNAASGSAATGEQIGYQAPPQAPPPVNNPQQQQRAMIAGQQQAQSQASPTPQTRTDLQLYLAGDISPQEYYNRRVQAYNGDPIQARQEINNLVVNGAFGSKSAPVADYMKNIVTNESQGTQTQPNFDSSGKLIVKAGANVNPNAQPTTVGPAPVSPPSPADTKMPTQMQQPGLYSQNGTPTSQVPAQTAPSPTDPAAWKSYADQVTAGWDAATWNAYRQHIKDQGGKVTLGAGKFLPLASDPSNANYLKGFLASQGQKVSNYVDTSTGKADAAAIKADPVQAKTDLGLKQSVNTNYAANLTQEVAGADSKLAGIDPSNPKPSDKVAVKKAVSTSLKLVTASDFGKAASTPEGRQAILDRWSNIVTNPDFMLAFSANNPDVQAAMGKQALEMKALKNPMIAEQFMMGILKNQADIQKTMAEARKIASQVGVDQTNANAAIMTAGAAVMAQNNALFNKSISTIMDLKKIDDGLVPDNMVAQVMNTVLDQIKKVTTIPAVVDQKTGKVIRPAKTVPLGGFKVSGSMWDSIWSHVKQNVTPPIYNTGPVGPGAGNVVQKQPPVTPEEQALRQKMGMTTSP